MYEKLYKTLDKWQEGNESNSLLKVIEADKRVDASPRLRTEIIDHVVSTIKAGYPRKPSAHELRCGVEHNGLTKKGVSGADLVVKKLLSLSTTSFIHCGHIHENSEIGFQQYWNDIVPFLDFVVRYRPLVEENLIVPIASYSFREDIGDFGHRDDVTETQIGKEILHLNLSIEEIEKQFFESPNLDYKSPPGSVEIFLPHLKTVDMQTIVRLRRDEQDAFIRYHRYLSDFFRDSAVISNERSIVDCLQRIDEGVRETDVALNLLKKKNIYNGLALSVGLSSVALCLFLPSEIAEYIRAVVGGATGVAALHYVASTQDSSAKIKNADFYFPWLLHKESKT